MGDAKNHNGQIASQQWGDDRADRFDWVSDRKRTDSDLVNPMDQYYEGLKTASQRFEEFNDAAVGYLWLKQANVIDPEERADIPKKDFAQPKKENPETETKGKYPIPDRQHARSALGFAKMHGDSAGLAAVRKKVEQKYPDMLEKEADFEDEHGTGGPALRDRPGLKKAILPPVNPPVADSSVDAASSSELSAKTAGVLGSAAKVVGSTLNKPGWRGALVNGAGWGAGTAAINAALAKPGHRGRAAAAGFGAGMLGGMAEHGMKGLLAKAAQVPLSEIKAWAAERYPQEAIPSLSDEAHGLWDDLRKKYSDYKKARLNLVGVTPPHTPPPPVLPSLGKTASVASAAKQVLPTNFESIMLSSIGAGLLGVGTYLTSKPRKELGDKSRSEVAFESDVRSNKARGGENYEAGLRDKITDFKLGLSQEMRKHPVAAAMTGASIGAGLGTQLARIMGAFKR